MTPAELGERQESLALRVDTGRFGPFVFQLGIDCAQAGQALQRVKDAHERFNASPLSQVANQLEREVVVSSVFGTNTIEGGTLSEDETAVALALAPTQVKEVEQRRVVNIKAAYDLSKQAANTPGWRLDKGFILDLHRLITADIPHPDNRPGLIRDNPKGRLTYVGDKAHGGRYKPPQSGKDIQTLLDALIEWQGHLEQAGVPALIRAPLAHLYYELIHPFWDGNGRVGRVIEATLLQAAGYRYAPFALARYYYVHIDEYFALFNACRKAADKKGYIAPNHTFVAFHLEGMRQTINTLHDRVNRIVSMLLYESLVRRALENKEINPRQYTIACQLLDKGPLTLEEIRQMPLYQSLYLKLNDKTRQRDLRRLREMGLVFLDTGNRLWPGFVQPPNVKPLGKREE